MPEDSKNQKTGLCIRTSNLVVTALDLSDGPLEGGIPETENHQTFNHSTRFHFAIQCICSKQIINFECMTFRLLAEDYFHMCGKYSALIP